VFALFCTVVLIIVYIIKNKKFEWNRQMIVGIIAVAMFGIYLLFTRFNVKPCLENLIIPFLLFMALAYVNKPHEVFINFFHAYSNLVMIIAVVSLIFFFLGPIFRVVMGEFFAFYNYGTYKLGINFFYVFFENFSQYQDFGGKLVSRNIGIFMESPDYATTLLIALFWKLFYGKKFRIAQCIILGITLITTFSAKGYLLGAAIVAGYFLFIYCPTNEKLLKWRKKFLPIVIGIGVIGAVALIAIKASSITGSGSVSIRLDDMLAALRTWMDHPVFGAGFYDLEEFYQNYEWTTLGGDPTCGILNVLAFGGIYMFAMYAFGFINFTRKLEIKREVRIGFAILFLALMSISAMQYNYLTLFILALGWML